jgi:hypothetical protein
MQNFGDCESSMIELKVIMFTSPLDLDDCSQ